MNEIPTLVWYYGLDDEIIVAPHIDAMFYILDSNVEWHLLTCIGEL